MSENLRSIQDERLKKARERKLRWWNKNKEKLLEERRTPDLEKRRPFNKLRSFA